MRDNHRRRTINNRARGSRRTMTRRKRRNDTSTVRARVAPDNAWMYRTAHENRGKFSRTEHLPNWGCAPAFRRPLVCRPDSVCMCAPATINTTCDTASEPIWKAYIKQPRERARVCIVIRYIRHTHAQSSEKMRENWALSVEHQQRSWAGEQNSVGTVKLNANVWRWRVFNLI